MAQSLEVHAGWPDSCALWLWIRVFIRPLKIAGDSPADENAVLTGLVFA